MSWSIRDVECGMWKGCSGSQSEAVGPSMV